MSNQSAGPGIPSAPEHPCSSTGTLRIHQMSLPRDTPGATGEDTVTAGHPTGLTSAGKEKGAFPKRPTPHGHHPRSPTEAPSPHHPTDTTRRRAPTTSSASPRRRGHGAHPRAGGARRRPGRGPAHPSRTRVGRRIRLRTAHTKGPGVRAGPQGRLRKTLRTRVATPRAGRIAPVRSFRGCAR